MATKNVRSSDRGLNYLYQLLLLMLTWFTTAVNPAQAISKINLPQNLVQVSGSEKDAEEAQLHFFKQYAARSSIATEETNAAIASEIEKVKIVFFKDADDFATTYDKAGTVSAELRNEAFNLYKKGKWGKLEDLFVKNNLNKSGTTVWPPASGGYNIVDDIAIKAGEKFDRYGNAINYSGTGIPNLGGSFTSPMPDGVSYAFGQRALNLPENGYDFYYQIEVLQDLPFKGQTADIIPWFGQVGGGKQTMWKIPANPNSPQGYSYTLTELAQLGLIKIIIKKSPSGKYPNLVNTVIQKR